MWGFKSSNPFRKKTAAQKRNEQPWNCMGLPSCSSVRTRLTKLLSGPGQTQAKLCQDMDVSVKSFRGFMDASGKWGGAQNHTYRAALAFLELQKKERKTKPKAQKEAEAMEVSRLATQKASEWAQIRATMHELEQKQREREERQGDYEDEPITMTTTTVRKKLRQFLSEGYMNQTALMNMLGVGSSSWVRFMDTAHPTNMTYEQGFWFLQRVQKAKKLLAQRNKKKAASSSSAASSSGVAAVTPFVSSSSSSSAHKSQVSQTLAKHPLQHLDVNSSTQAQVPLKGAPATTSTK